MKKQMAVHSPAWVAQTWVSFIVSVGTTAIGIYNLPTDIWVQGFLGMGLLFSVGSAISLAKTLRDQHESERQSEREEGPRLAA